MFPSWDSLAELENFKASIDRLGFWSAIVAGLIATVLGGLWAHYNNRLGGRIEELKAARDEANATAMKGDLDGTKSIAIEAQRRLNDMPQTKGVLIPGDGATPGLPNVRFTFKPASTGEPTASDTLLFLGNCAMVVREFPCRLVTQDGEDMLLIEREDDRLFVSLMAFDGQERAYLRIKRNEFKAFENNVFEMEQTPQRLTVTGANLRKVFDIEYINPKAIRITGDFYIREGVRLNIQMDKVSFGNGREWSGLMLDGGGFHFIGKSLPPLFIGPQRSVKKER